jgi:hypothetical protein
VKSLFAPYLSIILLFILSCSPYKPDESTNCQEIVSGKLVIKYSKTIPVKGRQYDHKSRTIWYDKTRTLFFGLNGSKNCIDVYDLTNESILSEICIKTDGSEESILVDEILVHNPDSIFLFSEDAYKIHLINSRGELIDKYNLQLGKINDWFKQELTGGIEYSIIKPFYNNKEKALILPTTPVVEQNDNDYYEQPNLLTYNIKTHEYGTIGGAYPSDFIQKPQSLIQENWWAKITHSFGLDSVLVSYYGSHKMILFNLKDNRPIREFCRKSGMMGDFDHEMYPDGGDGQRKFVIETPYYANAVYHEEQEKFITQTKHKQMYKDKQGKLNIPANAATSLIIQNKSFEQSFEVILNPEYYSYYYSLFLYQNGIVVLRNQYESDQFDEKFMVFDFYEL